MKREQVKIFSKKDRDVIENDVNAFLSALNPEQKVVDIKFVASDNYYDILVIYK